MLSFDRGYYFYQTNSPTKFFAQAKQAFPLNFHLSYAAFKPFGLLSVGVYFMVFALCQAHYLFKMISYLY